MRLRKLIGAASRARNLPELGSRLRHIDEGRARFIAAEVGRRSTEAEYSLRGSGVRFFLRHHTADGIAFNDVFLRRLYEPPPPVAAVLDTVPRPLRVVDLGAHIGLFGVYVLHRFGDAQITALEPSPANAELLRRCVGVNRPRAGRWDVHEACAATIEGWGELDVSGDEISAHLSEPGHPGALRVPTRDVLALLPDTDLLKIDIEGAEWPILRDPRFAAAGVPAIVLEYHVRGCGRLDPGGEAERLLSTAGYSVSAAIDQGEGMGMLWAHRSGGLSRRGSQR